MPPRVLWTWSFNRWRGLAPYTRWDVAPPASLKDFWELFPRWLLSEHAHSVDELEIEGFKDTLRVTGTVASEATKRAIILRLRASKLRIDAWIDVAAPFRPAADPYRGDPWLGDTPEMATCVKIAE